MRRRRRFAHLLPLVVFLVLRALSHAHPAPLPWTSGIFDANGVDDVLQAIRISYVHAGGVWHDAAGWREPPTGRVLVSESVSAREAFVTAAQPRAPPGAIPPR